MQQIQTKYDDHMKKMSSILLIISQQVKIQNESIERCYTTLNEVLPILSPTLEVCQHVITKPSKLNIHEFVNAENETVLTYISHSLEYIKDRDDLLSTNQKVLTFLIEQQHVLMIQGINNLITYNEH